MLKPLATVTPLILACVHPLAALPGLKDPTELLPPAPAWHGKSESLIAPPYSRWITPAETSGLMDSPPYDETVRYLRRLASASPWLSIHTFGQTPQGRDMIAVIASKDRSFHRKPSASAHQKPVLLAQSGIHSGEIDGKDAGMMLLRDIVTRSKDALINEVHFVFVPVFNIDGHERSSAWNRPNQRGPIHQGWRTTAQNLNLNRDYVKADAPEMRAMLGLINRYNPSLYLDLHVTDGVDYQYDITFGYNGYGGVESWSPNGAKWLDTHFRTTVTSALQESGHIPGALVFARNDRDITQGLSDGHGDARFSTGYGDARHLPTVLVENHSLKPFRQRVLGTYVLLEAALQELAKSGAELKAAIARDQQHQPATIQANYTFQGGAKYETDFAGIDYELYTSEASGTQEVRWKGTPKLFPKLPVFQDKPTLHFQRPKAYWVPSTKPEIIDRLKAHGIQLEVLQASRRVPVEMRRLVDPKPSAQPFESHYTITARTTTESLDEIFPKGSVRVPTDQPLGVLACIMLEPEVNDSLFSWGFFPEILQRTEYIEGYVVAPMAERMLKADPKLRSQFESKVQNDPAFAKNAEARLQWFYERSPFYDHRFQLYPVGIER